MEGGSMTFTKAQLKFLGFWVSTQEIWLQEGVCIGACPNDGHEWRSFRALFQKGAIDSTGQITAAGLKAFNRYMERAKR
jgi:hypothetical protein